MLLLVLLFWLLFFLFAVVVVTAAAAAVVIFLWQLWFQKKIICCCKCCFSSCNFCCNCYSLFNVVIDVTTLLCCCNCGCCFSCCTCYCWCCFIYVLIVVVDLVWFSHDLGQNFQTAEAVLAAHVELWQTCPKLNRYYINSPKIAETLQADGSYNLIIGSRHNGAKSQTHGNH